MKLNFALKFLVLGLSTSLILSSCGEDPVVDPVLDGPNAEFVAGTNLLTTDAEVGVGTFFTVNLVASKGDSDLKVLTIQEDGVNVPLERIAINNSPATSNPALLFGNAVSSFDYLISVVAHTDLSEKTYSYVVEDVAGNKATRSLKIKSVVLGTPVTVLEGTLLNSAGPINTGGLDLETGIGTGSNDPRAKIKDSGIDLGLPNATNWKQKISGANGSQLKYIVKGQNGVPESFTFSAVTFKEEIAALWSAGNAFTESNKINVGDVIMVLNSGKYYIFEVKQVNITSNDNSDNYVLDIKY